MVALSSYRVKCSFRGVMSVDEWTVALEDLVQDLTAVPYIYPPTSDQRSTAGEKNIIPDRNPALRPIHW